MIFFSFDFSSEEESKISIIVGDFLFSDATFSFSVASLLAGAGAKVTVEGGAGGEELSELSKVIVSFFAGDLITVVGEGGGAFKAGGVILAGPNRSLMFNLGDWSILKGVSTLGERLRFLPFSSWLKIRMFFLKSSVTFAYEVLGAVTIASLSKGEGVPSTF